MTSTDDRELVTQHHAGLNGFVWAFGRVENRDDPLKLGRVQVRWFGIHPDDGTLVPTEDLPWAVPMQGVISAAVGGIGRSPTGVVEGSVVFGFFMDGRDAQLPVYMGTVAGGVGQALHLNAQGQLVGGFDAAGNPVGPNVTAPFAKGATLPPVGKGFLQKAPTIAQQLMARYGLQDFQACGIVGNLGEESGIQPNVIEGGSHGPPPPAGTTLVGYGYAQWTNPRSAAPGTGRLDRFVSYCQSNGLDPQTDQANYSYFCAEIDQHYSGVVAGLKGTGTIEDATQYWMNAYERPRGTVGIPGTPGYQAHFDVRVNYARQALNAMKGVNVPVRSTGSNTESNTAFSSNGSQNTASTSVYGSSQPVYGHTTLVGPEPPSPYHGEYPYNHSMQTESGHLQEFDDTPGHERILTRHRSGTYTEVGPDGSQVVKVVGDNTLVVVGQDTVYVQGPMMVEVHGDARITCYNDAGITVAGDVGVQAVGDVRVKAGGDMYLEADGDVNVLAGGKINAQSRGDTNLNSGGQLLMGSSGLSSLKSGGNFAVDAPQIHLNDGSSTAPGTAPSTGLSTTVKPDTTAEGAASPFDEVFAEHDDDPSGMADAYNQAVSSGQVSQSQLQAQPAPATMTDGSPPKAVKPVSKVCNGLDQLSSISDSTRLSRNFTVYGLTKGVVVNPGKHAVQGQNGLTIGQVACNLSLLAQNVVEPILARYPNLRVNSGFRVNDSKQHGLGQAVDLTYTGMTNADVFAVAQWIKDNVPFDQLLLERGLNQVWTHVSFNVNGNRGQILSCLNPGLNATYVPGLQL